MARLSWWTRERLSRKIRPRRANIKWRSYSLGIAAGIRYDAFSFTLPPRSRLLLYSDGLTDALSDQHDSHSAFGVRGIAEALRTGRNRPLDQALEYLFLASSAYTGGHGRHDDTSVLLLERGGD